MPNDTKATATTGVSKAQSEAATERIKALTDFVARVGPCVGEGREQIYQADETADETVIEARTAALVAAYGAIGRLARES